MPQPARWTVELKDRFLASLARSRNASLAARACGLSRRSAYQLRSRDPAFARAWAAVFREQDPEADGAFDRYLIQLDRAPRDSNRARFAELLRRVRSGE